MAEALEPRQADSPGWSRTRERHPDLLTGIVAASYEDALAAAERAYRQRRMGKALQHLSRAASLAQRRALPHLLAGDIFLEMGRLQQATTAYRRALELDPSDDRALSGLSRAGAQRAAPAEPPWDASREVPPQRPFVVSSRLSARQVLLVLAPYLVLLAVAEYAVTFVNPMLAFPLHGGMIAVLTVHLTLLDQTSRRHPTGRYMEALLLTLMLSPLIRLISLTLPLPQLPDPYQFMFAGIPMMIGAFMVARYVGFRPAWIGLAWRGTSWQLMAIAGSVAIGVIEFAILRPDPMGALPWTAAGALPALSVAFGTGFPEELIFRGMMQTAARPLIGSTGAVVYASVAFAALHIGYQSGIDVAFVFSVSLWYGWIFERSRSIIGVSIGHGLANVVLFFVGPNLL